MPSKHNENAEALKRLAFNWAEDEIQACRAIKKLFTLSGSKPKAVVEFRPTKEQEKRWAKIREDQTARQNEPGFALMLALARREALQEAMRWTPLVVVVAEDPKAIEYQTAPKLLPPPVVATFICPACRKVADASGAQPIRCDSCGCVCAATYPALEVASTISPSDRCAC
jgi:hypothetical protein